MIFLNTGRVYEADGVACAVTIDGHETWGYRVWSLVRGSVRVRGYVCAVLLTPQAAVSHADTLNAAVDAAEAPENNDTNVEGVEVCECGMWDEGDCPNCNEDEDESEPSVSERIMGVKLSNNPHGAGPNHKTRPDRCSCCGEEGHKYPTCDHRHRTRFCSNCGYRGHDRRTCTVEKVVE